MNPSVLLQKLIEIERSIGVENEITTRRKVLEAQDYLLRVQWDCETAPEPRVIEGDPRERFSLLRKFGKQK